MNRDSQKSTPEGLLRIFDTQIISYAMKNSSMIDGDIAEFSITSTVAQEFLRVRDTISGSARYFTPPPYGLHPKFKELYLAQQKIHADRPSDMPLFKRSTDKLIMSFNNEFPPVVEYGHAGIAYLLNTGNKAIFSESINHLSKRERKDLIGKFMFLTTRGVNCIPVQQKCIPLAFDLLKRFSKRGFNLKQNFRNSLNDMLIFGTALANEADLWTKDELLAQFAEEERLSTVKSRGDHYELAFDSTSVGVRRISQESKKYVNVGWRFVMHRPPVHSIPITNRK